jgi:hypothetical protein
VQVHDLATEHAHEPEHQRAAVTEGHRRLLSGRRRRHRFLRRFRCSAPRHLSFLLFAPAFFILVALGRFFVLLLVVLVLLAAPLLLATRAVRRRRRKRAAADGQHQNLLRARRHVKREDVAALERAVEAVGR